MIYLALVPVMALARRIMGGPVSKNWGRGLSFLAGFGAAWTVYPWWMAALIGLIGPLHFTIDHAGDWGNAWNEKMRYSTVVLVAAIFLPSVYGLAVLAGVESLNVSLLWVPLATGAAYGLCLAVCLAIAAL